MTPIYTTVPIPDRKERGTIITKTAYPKSYFIATYSGTLTKESKETSPTQPE
jgi:hypothetical protein